MMRTKRCTNISILLLQMLLALICLRTGTPRQLLSTSRVPAFIAMLPSNNQQRCITHRMHYSTINETSTQPDTKNGVDDNEVKEESEKYIPPWSLPPSKSTSSSRASRFRQHVNPLSRRYQMSTDLPDQWPQSDFKNVNLPLYLDIGCGKGGFLLELVGRRHGQKQKSENNNDRISTTEVGDDSYMNSTKTFVDTTNNWLPLDGMNYLGLEIRPGVSQYAQARVKKRGLDGVLSFVGCNANVDLDRLLTLYQESALSTADGEKNNRLAFVSIQFPDPHFKKAHAKRRVVTPELVTTLSKFMNEGDAVFLQSDIKDALESMREQFVENDGKTYFDEWLDYEREEGQQEEYGVDNPLGIPTEREVSVLKRGLPVYRTLFKRNGAVFE